MFECVKIEFPFARCLRPGERRSSQIVAEDGHAALGKSGTRMDEEKNGRYLKDLERQKNYIFSA